jgi:SAM-dependent methyltransferase
MRKIGLFIKEKLPRSYYFNLLHLYGFFNSFFYFGSNHKCILCGRSSRKLLPTGIRNESALDLIGGGYRLTLCPFCFSADRERLIYYYLKNKTDIFNLKEKVKILHIAPGESLKKRLNSYSSVDYTSGDMNPSPGDIKIDITDIKFEDNSFDIIICCHVLEHVLDDKKAMKEIFRVLKPGGFAILQVPISRHLSETFEDPSVVSPEEREEKFGQKDHVRVYGRDYGEKLKEAGFKLSLYDVKKDLSIEEMRKYGLNIEEILYVSGK